LNFAPPGTGSTSLKFDAQRYQALPTYFYAKADISRTQPLPDGAEAYGKIDGQITPDALLSSEQYAAGGENSVRGYLEAEELGDYGAHGTTELRSPSLAPLISTRINDLRFLVFFDGALLRLHQPLPDEASTFPLAGTGIGARLQAFQSLHASADLAFPLVNGAVRQAGVPFIHFRVWSEL
jgi:hemolysin activation/secretion protein